MDTCPPPEQYYICTANGYSGCCSENPCGEPEATCPYSATATGAIGISITTADVSGSILDSTDMEDPTTPDPTTFNIAVISAPSSLANVLTGLVTATAWAPTAMSTTSALFGGALSQISVTEGVVLQFSSAMSTVATEPEAATSTFLGSSPSGVTTTSSPSSPPSAAIAGGVVAGLVGALLISVLICWLRMHRRKRGPRYQNKEKADIVVQTLFDVPPSEVFGDSRTTSAGASEKRKTGGGILAFINRRQTTDGEANATSESIDRRHITSDNTKTNVAFNPMVASGVIKKRQTTDYIANVAPESTDRRHTTSDNAEINNAYNPIAASEVTEARRTMGGNPSAVSNIHTQRHTVGGIADTNTRFDSSVASEVVTKRHTPNGIAEVVPEVNKRRLPAGLKVETNSDINYKRHTIGGEARAASEATNKRHTTG